MNILSKCLNEVNSEAKTNGLKKLKNLWNKLSFDSTGVGAFSDFEDDPDAQYLWRRYITDESLERKLFRNMDRIKLTYIMIERVFNKISAERGKVLVDDFPFHNRFSLFGERRFADKEKDHVIAEIPKGAKIKN